HDRGVRPWARRGIQRKQHGVLLEGREMINRIVLAALAGSSLFLAYPTLAQRQPTVQPDAASGRPLTLAERQAAWNDHKAEYRRRVAQDGQRSADRWLDQQALAKRG